MAIIRIRTTQNVQIEYLSAGLGRRILATLIDFAVYVAYALLLGLLFDEADIFSRMQRTWIIVVPMFLYHLLCEAFMGGQSLGKRAMSIKVVSLDGKKPSLGQYFIRWVMRLVDIMLIFPGGVAVIAVAASSQEQRLGDLAAGTTVISLQKKFKRPEVKLPEFEQAYEPTYQAVTALSDKDIRTLQQVLRAYPHLQKKEVLQMAAQKVKDVLDLHHAEQKDLDFIRTVVKDYQHLTSV